MAVRRRASSAASYRSASSTDSASAFASARAAVPSVVVSLNTVAQREMTNSHHHPTSRPPCSTAAARTTRPLESHTPAPAPAPRGRRPSRCALNEGSLRAERHDETADPRNTTGLFAIAEVYLDDRPTSERRHADRAPRERCAALKRTREHIFSPAAVRGRVAR